MHRIPGMRTLMSWVLTLQATVMTSAWGQEPLPVEHPPGFRSIEGYTTLHKLNAGYSDWKEIGVRATMSTGQHQWHVEAATMNRFDLDGSYGAISDTFIIDPDWYASISFGKGNGAIYLPDYRVDGFIHRKFLSDRSLMGNLGWGRYKAPDGHQDDNINVGFTYYLDMPLVLQGEARRIQSRPGDVYSNQFFLAATWGHAGKSLLTMRRGWGHEGYQAIGATQSITGYASNQLSLSYKRWVERDWGWIASLENYRNPYYQRDGIGLSLFKELP